MSGLLTCHLEERPNRQAPFTAGAGLPQGESDPVAGFSFTSKNLVDSGDQHRPQVVLIAGIYEVFTGERETGDRIGFALG